MFDVYSVVFDPTEGFFWAVFILTAIMSLFLSFNFTCCANPLLLVMILSKKRACPCEQNVSAT